MLPVAACAAVLAGFASTARAWPVAPSGEPTPCEPGQACSAAAPGGQPSEGGAAGAGAATGSAAGDGRPQSEDAAVVPPPPSPLIDAEDPPGGRVGQPLGGVPALDPAEPELIPARVLMLNVGLHKFVGDASDGFYPGLRTGVLLGGRLNPQFSGNAELVIDLMNPDTPDGISATELFFDLTFSPLVHAPLSPTTQFILGPRLGIFYLAESISAPGLSGSVWGWGWAGGVNAGMLSAQGTVHIGFLASFVARSPEKVCVDTRTSSEECVSNGLHAAKLVSLAFLAML